MSKKRLTNDKLATPVLTVSGSTLTASNIDDHATSLYLKRDGSNYKNLFIINDTYTNVTASSHVGLIGGDETVIISISADGTNYKMPATVTVTGATGVYVRTSDTAGTLTISSPLANVSFTVAGVAIYSISATATNATINGSTSYSGTISSGETVTLTLGADGTSYKLPTTAPTVTGCTGTYTRTSDTQGTLVLSDPTSNISFTVEGISAGLATPTEVSVNSHDIMFLNATTEADAFEIYVDNVSLGTVSVPTLPDVSSVTAVDNELTVTVPDGTDAVGIFVDNVYLDAVDI